MTIEEGAAALDLRVTPEHTARLESHLRLLMQWNRMADLVSPGSADQMVERHFLDSLLLLRMAQPKAGWRIADVGSGAGFPGLVWAIVRPDLAMTLIEPRRKRAAFLERVLIETATLNAEVVVRRAEALHEDSEHKGRYDLAVARAVGGYTRVLEAAGPLVRPGGTVFVSLAPSNREPVLVAPQYPNSRTGLSRETPRDASEMTVPTANVVEALTPWAPQRTRRAAVFRIPDRAPTAL